MPALGEPPPNPNAGADPLGAATDTLARAFTDMDSAVRGVSPQFDGLAKQLAAFAAAVAAAQKTVGGPGGGPPRNTYEGAAESLRAGLAAVTGTKLTGRPGPGKDNKDDQDDDKNPAAKFAASVSAASFAVARFAQQPMQLLNTAIGAVQSQVAGLVGKFQPAAVMRFQNAVDDLYASIGRILLPVMERFTQLVRVVGSVFNGLDENGQKAVQALVGATVGMVVFAAGAAAVEAAVSGGIGPLLGAVAGALGGVAFASGALDAAMKPLAEVFGGIANRVGEVLSRFAGSDAVAAVAMAVGEVVGQLVEVGTTALEFVMPAFNALAQVIKALAPAVVPLIGAFTLLNPFIAPVVVAAGLLAVAFEVLAPILTAVAEVITKVVNQMTDVLRTALAFLGLSLPTARRSESSDNTNMAAKQAQTGGIEDVLKRAREASYSLGGPSKAQDPVASGLKKIDDRLKNDVVTAIRGLPTGLVKAFMEEAGKEVKRRADQAVQRAPDVVRGIGVGGLLGGLPGAAIGGFAGLTGFDPAKAAVEMLDRIRGGAARDAHDMR